MKIGTILTPALAYASGKDAGNRSMREEGRTKWNADDYNTASKVTNRLLDSLKEVSTNAP